MPGPFVHNIDPIIFTIFGVHVWWYGLSFTLGFLNAHVFLRRNRNNIGLTLSQVYDLTIFLALGILIGGRGVIVFNNEWAFYREFPSLIPAIWVGGFASHGLILGGAIGVTLFCLLYRIPFRPIFDVLAIAAAIILGFGRIGNFLDGQIHGSLTDLPWGVQFPNVEGVRHPVVLYDGLKNFLLVPLLVWLRSFDLPPGRLAAVFVILYSGFRIPIDLLREYPITTWGLPTGQTLNGIMLTFGVIFLLVNIYRSRRGRSFEPSETVVCDVKKSVFRPLAFAALCILPLVIPSDATRDIPDSYGKRHEGLKHSWMYPPIANDLKRTDESPKGR